MRSRDVALTSLFLALATVAHFLARFTQVGGIQMAPSIAFYAIIPFLIQLSLGEALLVGFITGLLLMVATSSPFPLANIPSHWSGFMVAYAVARYAWRRGEPKLLHLVVGIVLSILVSGPVFIVVAYYGLTGLPSLAVSMEAAQKFSARFASLGAFFTFAMTFIVIPTLLLNAFVIGPALFMPLRSATQRYGFSKTGVEEDEENS